MGRGEGGNVVRGERRGGEERRRERGKRGERKREKRGVSPLVYINWEDQTFFNFFSPGPTRNLHLQTPGPPLCPSLISSGTHSIWPSVTHALTQMTGHIKANASLSLF